MIKYTYKEKATGKKVYSDVPLKRRDLILVSEIRDGRMKGNRISKK